MKRNFKVLSGRLLFTFVVVLVAGAVLVPNAEALMPPVLINEFNLDGIQWVELMNTTDSDIDLSTWEFATAELGPGPVGTTTLSGTLPARGLITFTPNNTLSTSYQTVLYLNDGATNIYTMSYGGAALGGEPNFPSFPSIGESVALTGGTNWGTTTAITRGWYNEGPAPTMADIVSLINAGGVVTNMDTLPDPTTATDLYFEKRTDISSSTTALGRLTFAGLSPLNLTNASTTALLQDLGTKMSAAAGSISLDARLATDLKNAGATISMYQITSMGYDVSSLSLSDLVVRDDDGVIIDPSDVTNYPNLSLMSTSPDNDGTFTFNTDHFTQFGFNSLNVYVNASNTGAEDGSEANPYNTIQEGIDAVPEGGTVNVATGDYTENVIINKALTLIGASTSTVSVISGDSSSDVFDVNANGVNISGFTVSGAGSGAGIDLDEADSCDVHGNYLTGNKYGIWLYYADSNTLTSNIANGNNQIGFFLVGSTGNELATNTANSNANGFRLQVSSNENTLTSNIVNGNGRGIHILHSSNNIFTGNTVGESASDGFYLQNNSDNNEITGNTINENDGAGIYLNSGTGNSIQNNTITNNGSVPVAATGIHILSALGNSAHNNIISSDKDDEGINNEDKSNIFDASENYWGGANGPYNDVSNPTGNASSSVVGNVKFRPYYTDEARTTLSTVAVDPSNISDLFGNGGSFSVPDGETPTAANQVNVDEAITISVATGAGTSSVALPVGTVITKTDGGTFDASDLTAASTTIGGLSGFASGQVVEGAFEWGLPSLGLTFSSPITINIYVGTALNGQTLTIYRSLSQTSGWETSGIVAPGTCVVTAGICSFQTTKASYFAATKSVAISSPSSSSRGGSSIISMVTVPAVVATSTKQVFTFSRNLTIGSRGDDVKALQIFLNASGFLIAKTGAGSPGNETNYFGALTRSALIKFQEAHAAEILTPLGLTKGTGFFGLATRTFIGKK